MTTSEMLDTPLTSRMYIDRNELLRVRVESDEFFDDEPGPPKASEGVIIQRPLRRSPFQVIVCHQLAMAPISDLELIVLYSRAGFGTSCLVGGYK